MLQCRDPVAHKICIRKLDGYLFILNNIVSEKWSLGKSLSSLIRRIIQLPSSAKKILFLLLNVFSTGYQIFTSFNMSYLSKLQSKSYQVQFTNGMRCIILQRFNGKCKNSPVRTSKRFPKHVTFTPWYGLLVMGNTLS